MAASLKLKPSFPRLISLLHPLQRFNHTLIEGGLEADLLAELGPKSMAAASGQVDTSKWKKLDSRSMGITLSMIPDASRIVLRILQSEGHDAYLVGGCVRDLLLNKIPKDFDVITTANLQEIKLKFHRAYKVGRRFPICRVHVKGSVVEVSSFETVAKDAKQNKEIRLSDMPKGYDEKDLMRWKNSLHRDFTINSLFYDPFAHKIYDYSNGMTDLTSMKLRTLKPAHLSFEEDCARILRGLRIAARLGFSFSKDTEKAIRNLCTSVKTLDKARLMMEMNYMLSYGAAEPSLLLLKRFNLLELLLPFHAAYLASHSGQQNPVMLMKLFFNLDNVVSCDQPCDSGLWVSLLAFHLALVNNPQDALVVWTFASILYHGKWKEGVKAVREIAEKHVSFVPEILESSDDATDVELAQRVSDFASIIIDSIDALTDPESLRKAMGRYPSFPCSEWVFISKNAGREAAEIFRVLVHDIESLRAERSFHSIDYGLLGKGDIAETRFVLGKVIMDTMRGGPTTTRHRSKIVTENKDDFCASDPNPEEEKSKDRAKRRSNDHISEVQIPKKQKQKQKQKVDKEKWGPILVSEDIPKKKQPSKKADVAKDVEKLRSLKASLKGAWASKEGILSVLEKSPKRVKQDEAQAPMAVLNVLRQSNLFKGDKEDIKKDVKLEKEQKLEEEGGDRSKEIQKTRKLSSFFK